MGCPAPGASTNIEKEDEKGALLVNRRRRKMHLFPFVIREHLDNDLHYLRA
jgi:hypothetical protein